jgi:hypothetical protein
MSPVHMECARTHPVHRRQRETSPAGEEAGRKRRALARDLSAGCQRRRVTWIEEAVRVTSVAHYRLPDHHCDHAQTFASFPLHILHQNHHQMSVRLHRGVRCRHPLRRDFGIVARFVALRTLWNRTFARGMADCAAFAARLDRRWLAFSR